MPQPRSTRKSEPEAEEPEVREDEEQDEEEFDEDDQSGGSALNIDVGDDRVIIELPRNGNERAILEAIGSMLESMT